LNKHVIVGMSGGVDSAVAALLLKQEGYNVECVFMKNWEDDEDLQCTAEEDYADALQVCDRLNLPLRTVNFTQEYWDKVFKYFIDEYKIGRTPNPDVLCNKEIKFKAFLNYALKLGADFIATGHYALNFDTGNGRALKKGKDGKKDQSYFLYLLNQKALEKSLFPLGHLEKSDVRTLAVENGLHNAGKKDSTGVCFIGEQKYFKDFLKKYIPPKPGQIVTQKGIPCGKHDGLMYYTLGQRKGLGLGGGFGTQQEPWFVAGKNMEENTLIVVQGHNHPALYNTSLTAGQIHWISGERPSGINNIKAKIRYGQKDQSCHIKNLNNDLFKVDFLHPQFGVTPGQSIVFYEKNECLGGGIIENSPDFKKT